MTLKFETNKEYFIFIITIICITDLIILLNIPFLRQILGFLFLTILPGFLILRILKLNKIGFLEKFILSWGLSISFLMFFGLLINNLSLGLGYETPLSTISLLISLNIALITLAIIGHKVNKNSDYSLPKLNLNASEKSFLCVPILFPALSIFGMNLMNSTSNNIILIFLLFLIPAYVVFVCFLNRKFPKRLYAVVIFLISISLLLLLPLRSNHIIGSDIHAEYRLFQITLSNLHWSIFGHTNLDACLCISLLPGIYQSILNINPEFLVKIYHSIIYSVSPLIIYVIAKKYVAEGYAFLASFFFMSQYTFLFTEYYSRAAIAILFFALAMMTLFNDKIDSLKKRILFIVFMASCVVSHYSTTYIFFFMLLGGFAGMEILSKKYAFKKVISLTIVFLFFALIFFWYSQVTEAPFNSGVKFIEETFNNLNRFFVEGSRGEQAQLVMGKGIEQMEIPYKMQFVLTWITFALIGIGLVTLIRRYKEMSFPKLGVKKPDFLKEKFEIGYFVFSLVSSGLLVVMVATPYVSEHYDLGRLYPMAITILSVFFVIGGITIAKYLNKLTILCSKKFDDKDTSQQIFKKSLIKNLSLKKALPKKQKEGENALQVLAYLIILLVLIPYFLCVSDVIYNIFGVPRTLILNSEGEQYDVSYVHDQESYATKWIRRYTDEEAKIYSDYYGTARLVSQGMIRSPIYAKSLIEDGQAIKDGYIYLRYTGVVDGKLLDWGGKWHNITEYEGNFGDNNKIYDNGGSEVWR